jgi:transposase
MKRVPRQKYTAEFKLEAVRLVNSGVRLAEAARQLAVNENTLWNWCKADRDGKLVACSRAASAELAPRMM